MRVLAVGSGLLVLSGCGPFLGAGSSASLPDSVRHPNTAYQIEGEVRDESTLAAVPDAEVTIETDRPGYVVTRRSDAGGRFAIGYSAMYRGRDYLERFLFGDDTDAFLVSRISIRAEAPGRCSATHTFELDRVPKTRFLLLVGDCALYRARAR